MIVNVKPRQQGKTYDLIKMASEQWLYIVCMNLDDVKRISDMALSMGCSIPQPITFRDFLDSRKDKRNGIKGYLIDNADMLLQSLAVVPIVAVTMTAPDNQSFSNDNHIKSEYCFDHKQIDFPMKVNGVFSGDL